MHRHFTRLALALHHQQFIARIRRAGQAQHHHRDRGSGRIDRVPGLIEQRAHAAEFLADQQRIAQFERAAQHQYRCDRAAALLEARLDHVAGGEPGGRRLELEHFGLQQNAVEQLIDALAGARRDGHENILAAPLLGNDAVLGELLLDLLRIRLGLVHFVERHDDGHFGRLRVLNGLDGLRHDAVVGADHQNDDVGDLRAARAHGGEGRVAGRVEEGHHALGGFHVVRADVLRDAAGFARRHLGAADVVEQRGLAVIDVSHHRHDRRPRQHLERGIRLALQVVLDDVFLAQHRRVAHFLDHQHGGVLLDHLIDRRHHAHVHHDFDDFGGFDGHLLRQLAHGHGLADRHFAHHARGRHLKAMLGVGFAAHRAPPPVARFLLLVPRTHIADDVQFLPAVARRLVVHHLARGLAGLRRRRFALALRHLARLNFGDAPRLLFGGALAVFLIAAPPALLFLALAVQALLLQALVFRALERGLRLLLGLALPVDLFLLVARLILEHLALDVGALAAHFDIHGARAALGARELQLRLRLAAQRDFARRGIGLRIRRGRGCGADASATHASHPR